MNRGQKQRARLQCRLQAIAHAEQELAAVRDSRGRLGEVFVKLAQASAQGKTVELSPWELEPLLSAVRAAIHKNEIERNRR